MNNLTRLPKEVERTKDSKVWIKVKYKSGEMIFEQFHQHPRPVAAVVKPSEMAKYYVTPDGSGNIIDDYCITDMICPPKAWMTDGGQERCGMLAAAKLARGRVLIGGLGLAVYPQFATSVGEFYRNLGMARKEGVEGKRQSDSRFGFHVSLFQNRYIHTETLKLLG